MARVVTWHWGDKYGPEYIKRLINGALRHLPEGSDVTVISVLKGDPLIAVPGCFTRLKLFDPSWAQAQGFRLGERVLAVDLDLIVTGDLAPLFEDDTPFRILQGVNSSNPCPYNGSVWRLDIGYRPDVWSDFSLEAAAKVPFDSFPDDQAWLAHKLPGAAAFTTDDGVYAFQKPGWPRGEALPKNARIVAFPGWRDPVGSQHLEWVQEHWRT